MPTEIQRGINDRRFLLGIVIVAAGIGATAWSALHPGTDGATALLSFGAASAPAGVLLVVLARAGAPSASLRAAVGGAVVGPIVAIASHAAVAAFAYAFFLGFADTGRALFDAMRIDPRLQDVLASPWTIVFLVDLAVVAPLTEEAGKALGGFLLARPRSRRDAVVVGASAGAGFAVVENLLYAGLAAAFGGPWQLVVIARTVSAPVHVLASGVVALGVWDARRENRPGVLLRGYAGGVGVHALWNGSLVVLLIAATVGTAAPRSEDLIQLVFSATLGVVLAGALWRFAGRVAGGDRMSLDVRTREPVAGWVLLASSLLVPVAVLLLVFPAFRSG
jgi:RsiW-degrading membrane proteinase PrsW (M82 family)